MPYKTILVYVDESRHLKTRVGMAAKIAIDESAHLIGAAMTGISRFTYGTGIAGEPAGIAPYLDGLRKRAESALQTFEAIARQHGVTSFEKRLIDDEPAGGVSLQARYCDLVVLGQEDPDEPSPALMSGFPEYVVMSGGTPTLVVPYAGEFKPLGNRALIAWNASAEALQAVRGALPLLKRAQAVELVVFNPASRPDLYGAEPGGDMALYLARHGVKVDVMTEEIGAADTGSALLSLAANLGSDLLVMGCYGHSRFREMLLGGVTRTILQSMTVPVLMAR